MMFNPTISEVLGNRQRLDGGAMFGNVPRTVWERWTKPDAQGRIELACRALLVEIDGKRILCETGIGAFFEPRLAERYGVYEKEHVLLSSLQELGLTDRDIDIVILSHLHFDHAGGLFPEWSEGNSRPSSLLFPNALYIVGREAFDRAEHPHPRDRASYISELPPLLRNSGRLRIVEGSSHPDVLPNRISFFFTQGHTPGQMHTLIAGDKSKVIFAGDLVPGIAWVHLPVTMGYDRYAEQVIDEKSELYKSIANDEHCWLFYTHDANVAMSKIALDESHKYVPRQMIERPYRMEF